MAHNQNTGALGEQLAAEYLQRKGYDILERNWRFSRAEVDIIARHQKQLVFVEVKTRRSQKFGLPEESVTNRKQQQLVQAANAYLDTVDGAPELRFDVISIQLSGNTPPEIVHFEDAFYPYQA